MPVTLLDPTGQPREIPDDQVQAAIATGGKRALKITDPKGTLRWIPEDQKDAALQAGGKLADSAPAPDTRSLFQKAKDNFNAATQGSKPGDGAVKSFIEDVGAGGGDVIRSLANPLKTAESLLTAPPDPTLDYVVGDKERAVQNAKQMPNAARTIGQFGTGAIAGEIGGQVLKPVETVAKNAAGKAALLGKTPEAAYESALKPSTTLSQGERAAVVKTGLEQEIPISKGGLEKLGEKIETLNQSIKDEIAADPNRPIDPSKVATRADQAKARFSQQVNKGTDLNAIEASKQQFLDENPGSMGAADAQAMKQGTYRVLKGKFGEQGSASVEAQKALARGLKEEIASQFPEISKLNADESRLLDLQPVLERAVNRISNHQAIGIGTPVAGAAAKAVTGSGGVAAVASVLKGVLDNPGVKSRLAIAISKSSKIPISQAAAKVQAYSVSLGATAAASQGDTNADTPSQ